MARTATPVRVSYRQLCETVGTASLMTAIGDAFGSGPDALGLIVVGDVPDYGVKRARLLPLASRLAALPAESLLALEDPESRFMVGWSCGKERMNGRLDFSKGSFYANPQFDRPSEDPACILAYPESGPAKLCCGPSAHSCHVRYCHANKWPDKALPELRPAMRALGQQVSILGIHSIARTLTEWRSDVWSTWEPCWLITVTATLAFANYPARLIEDLVSTTRANKARLLHYHPRSAPVLAVRDPPEQSVPSEQHDVKDSWCGWHLDHSCLTALTAAMYMDNDTGRPLEADACHAMDGGLWIRTRGGQQVRVDIPVDCIAFQTGQAVEVASRHLLRATPHCVQAPSMVAGVARNTMAVFLQPDWTHELVPDYAFSKFTDDILSTHYP